MGVYTNTGDKGMTSLAGGSRISKDDLRVEAYGTIDELNSFVGLLDNLTEEVRMKDIQRNLFKIGGYLAYEDAKDSGITIEAIKQIELDIDEMEQVLTPLRAFILPGGTTAASVAHICRTVCRRAERCMVRFQHMEGFAVDQNAMIYINRLSDYFFVMARLLNQVDGRGDVIL